MEISSGATAHFEREDGMGKRTANLFQCRANPIVVRRGDFNFIVAPVLAGDLPIAGPNGFLDHLIVHDIWLIQADHLQYPASENNRECASLTNLEAKSTRMVLYSGRHFFHRFF